MIVVLVGICRYTRRYYTIFRAFIKMVDTISTKAWKMASPDSLVLSLDETTLVHLYSRPLGSMPYTVRSCEDSLGEGPSERLTWLGQFNASKVLLVLLSRKIAELAPVVARTALHKNLAT